MAVNDDFTIDVIGAGSVTGSFVGAINGSDHAVREAVARRDEIVSHLDDASHAEQLVEDGVTIVCVRATIVGGGRVEAGGAVYTALDG